MAAAVTGIEHPANIGAGTLATLKATFAPGTVDPKKLKWTYTEPYAGAKPQPLAKGVLSVTYIPPSKLAGKKITISARGVTESEPRVINWFSANVGGHGCLHFLDDGGIPARDLRADGRVDGRFMEDLRGIWLVGTNRHGSTLADPRIQRIGELV